MRYVSTSATSISTYAIAWSIDVPATTPKKIKLRKKLPVVRVSANFNHGYKLSKSDSQS